MLDFEKTKEQLIRELNEARALVARHDGNFEKLQLLAAIVRDSDDAIIGENLKAIITSWNPAAERIYQYTKNEALGQNISILLPPERVDELPVIVQRIITGTRTDRLETIRKRRDGVLVDITLSVSPIRDKDGAIVGASSVGRDMTAQKRADDALVQSEARRRILVGAIPDLVWLKDPSGRYLSCNHSFERFFGAKEADIVGKSDYDFVDKEQADFFSAHDREAMEAGGATANEEWLTFAGDGYWGLFETIKTPMRDEAGTIIGVLGIARDITERHKTEEALTEAKRKAEAAAVAKSEFLSNMSHEIRTPMNGILGMLQLLERTPLGDMQKEYVLAAAKAAKRLTRLLSDILDLSRMETGELSLEEGEFDMLQQKESLLDLFAAAARQKGLGFECILSEEIPPRLIGDKARLGQILFNLVGNAIKFSDKGSIRVEASLLPLASDGSCRVLFTVADNGVGIPDNRVKDLFEPFVQAEHHYTRSHQGAGLGLSLAQRLALLMGGELVIDSAMGEGTTVYLSLPFKLPDLKRPRRGKPSASARDASAERRLRALFVEDDETSLFSGRRMLELLGADVTEARNGQEALHLLAEQNFDLVFMDVQMPVMDGVEATTLIRASGAPHADIPIIALTSYAMAGDKETFLAAGMTDYIAKPMDMAALKDVMQRVMA